MSCPKDKILNPRTGRCVLKTGKIGKELLKNKKGSYKSSYSSAKDGNVKSDRTKELEREVKDLKELWSKSQKELKLCHAHALKMQQKYEIAVQNATHSHKQDHHSQARNNASPAAKQKHNSDYEKETKKLKELDTELKSRVTQLTGLRQKLAEKSTILQEIKTKLSEKEAERQQAHTRYVYMLNILNDTLTAADKKPDAPYEPDRMAQQVAINDAKRRIKIIEKKLTTLALKMRRASEEVEDFKSVEIKVQGEYYKVEKEVKNMEAEVKKYRSLYDKQGKVVDRVVANMKK